LASRAQNTAQFGWFLVAFLASRSAASQTSEATPPSGLSVVTAALELVAPEGCGSEAALGASITRRSDRIRIDPTSDRRLRIAIRADGALTRVELSLTQPTGRHSTRKLKASSCDEALEAAALVAAVSLDPAASTALEPVEEEKPPPSPAPPAVTNPPAAPPPPAPIPLPPPPRTERRARWSLGAVAVGEAHWAPAPEAMLGPGLVVHAGYELVSVLAPTLRVKGSLGFWQREVVNGGPGLIRFALKALTAEVCPVRLAVAVAGVLPCGFWMEGRLWTAGRKFPVTHDYDRPWRAYGGSLVAWYRPLSPVEVQATVQVGAAGFQYDSYLSEPFQYIHRVGNVYRSLSLGAGVTFP
jgi:hypothetical protein